MYMQSFQSMDKKYIVSTPLRATIHGAGDYSPQDLGTYTGSSEQAKRLGLDFCFRLWI